MINDTFLFYIFTTFLGPFSLFDQKEPFNGIELSRFVQDKLMVLVFCFPAAKVMKIKIHFDGETRHEGKDKEVHSFQASLTIGWLVG